jgi:hypothetical protein
MRRSSAAPIALLLVVALATAWAFSSMVGRRFTAGNVYPFYSSLRTDPLGTRALFESLDRLPFTTSLRSFTKLEKLEGTPGQTLMLLHVTPDAFSDGTQIDGEAVMKFAATGGRVVVTLNGQTTNWDKVSEAAERRRDENRQRRLDERRKAKGTKPADEKKKEAKKDDKSKTGKSRKDRDLDFDGFMRTPESLRSVLGVTFKQDNYEIQGKGGDPGLALEPAPGLPLSQSALPKWHARTTMIFEEGPAENPLPASDPDKDNDAPNAADSSKGKETPKPGRSTKDKWTVFAAIEDGPVLAERRFSTGSVILSTDGYFVSNEALMKKPSPRFLAWLVGEAREVIFDETHLGTVEEPGIMTLVRKHHLHGMFVGGIILFALFVWRSSLSLVPANGDDEDSSRIVSGHGATAGLVSLLKRGISRGQVLTRCFETWEKTAPRRHASMQTRLGLARAILPPPNATRARSGALVSLYRQICETLHPKRK